MTSPARHSVRRTAIAVFLSLVLLAGLLGTAAPALAATRADKLAVLSDWTQTSAASFTAWNTARADRAPWASYGFDWSTDSCSAAPDYPLGFDFALSCQRHDFGYRNYRAVDLFKANKARVDSAFLADLRRRCATYSVFVRPACDSLAWAYYQAVHVFGSLAAVSRSDLNRAATLKADARRATAN